MTEHAETSRYAIDSATLLELVAVDSRLPPSVQLIAPASIRSDALTTLLQRVQAGELSDEEARVLHTRMTEQKIRVLGDRVSRWTAFQLARDQGWSSLREAEYLAVAKLQADALVTDDPDMAAKARGVVRVEGLDALRP